MIRRASIDLNADVGEGAGHDADLVPLVSSVNIACGAHAGDAGTMRAAVLLALRHGAAIGAHPGFADREHFGRREIPVTPGEAAALVVGQARLLERVAAGLGATVGHVKLHGALYNMAARDPGLGAAVVEALVREGGSRWTLVALAGSPMVTLARARGLRVVGEAFADRTYSGDGSLTPRSAVGAVIADEEAAVRQALRIASEGKALCADGAEVSVDADTICLHGDGPHAVAFARRIRGVLTAAGIAVRRRA
jgi:UPF0271 protein